MCMGRQELRHDRHTVSLLTDHMVFSPNYRGKILVGDVHALDLSPGFSDLLRWSVCGVMSVEKKIRDK